MFAGDPAALRCIRHRFRLAEREFLLTLCLRADGLAFYTCEASPGCRLPAARLPRAPRPKAWLGVSAQESSHTLVICDVVYLSDDLPVA
jgi:hypothetical protein